ncbi:MAG: hypothetical protein E7437_04900 [Ruminococcaceae bacterium]|nr:hypothetical protein [Oscillospiraceae bacterium]
MKSCFMFGHADTPYSILPQIEAAVEMQYSQYGIRHFYVGSRGSFDALAATAVKRAKTRHPDIYLYLLLAYHPADRPVTLTDGFDGSYYPPLESVPRSYSIVRANRHMTQNTDSIICYVKHVGNSRNLLEYAQKQQAKRKLIIENLAGND